MSNELSSEEIQATSDALTRYWNLLTGKPAETPQEFLPKNSAAKCGLGRTREYEYSDYPNDLIEKAILFKKATHDDVDQIKKISADTDQKDVYDWSSLEITGPINSLHYITKGVDLPDIRTRVSAEGKTLERVNDEINAVYTLLDNLHLYLDQIDTFEENATAKDVLFEFFKEQYKITDPNITYDSVKELEDFNPMTLENDHELPNVKSIWKKDSTANKKRYTIKDVTDGHTDYMNFIIHTPNSFQYKTEQTTCMIRIGKLTPIDRLKTIVDKHLSKLKPVYQAAISGTSNQ